jgi:hypothetical protein
VLQWRRNFFSPPIWEGSGEGMSRDGSGWNKPSPNPSRKREGNYLSSSATVAKNPFASAAPDRGTAGR